ncbi:phosphate uptake regulator, PhoU [Nocardia terpenica]|uniref:phosphate signaling complex PhoU family protein n=1 Tax=Nocardia terpenica TaxID=455432 RepID=UPI002FE42377
MRTKFSSELAALTGALTRLAGLARDATECAAVAVAEANLTVAYEVFAVGEELQARYGDCENRAVILLALEAPVARDLRHVVSAIQIADDLSQQGSLTTRIADSVVRRYPDPVGPPGVVALLGEIGRGTAELTAAAHRAIAAHNPAPGQMLVAPDAALPELQQRVLRLIADPEWSHGSAMAVDLALLAHHFERCAEHSVRIGRLIQFFHTGTPLSAQPDQS